MKKNIVNKNFNFTLLVLFFVALISGYLLSNIKQKSSQNEYIPKKHEKSIEIEKIKSTDVVSKQSEFYIELIKRVGPEQAQDELFRSGIPFTGQGHLLNHTVGDYLYEKYGPAGITKCKDYFSSSCYHGFIINNLGSGKLDKIDTMLTACKKKSSATLSQCTHALGHGFLAYTGYANLTKALTLCDDIKKRVKDLDSYMCETGVFMENVWGLHEGKPSPDAWLSNTDLHYPCDDPRIADRYFAACWYNQAFQINKLFKGNLSKVGSECVKLDNNVSKSACFDGVFRALSSDTKEIVDLKFEKCNKMPSSWINKCIAIQSQAGYMQGDRKYAFEICARINETGKEECYNMLFRIMKYYSSSDERSALCSKIKQIHWQKECLKTAK